MMNEILLFSCVLVITVFVFIGTHKLSSKVQLIIQSFIFIGMLVFLWVFNPQANIGPRLIITGVMFSSLMLKFRAYQR